MMSFEKIVLVDDDEEDQKLFKDALCAVLPNCDLILLTDGRWLEAIILQEKPDAVFLDIYMPAMSGHECLKRIREIKEFNKLIIIAYSGSCQQSVINMSYGFGAHLYMIKPDSYQQLVSDLQRLFNLDWQDPEIITDAHYQKNQYQAFNC
jgi:CheY-like chemotaxis protein